MKTIRWGIIGVGDVTEVKSGPAFYKAPNSELVAVMRRSGEKAKDYAERHNVPKWYDDGDALINDPDVDVVYIATPQYAHKDYTLKVAAAGKPVYCEKPMALSHAECQEMIDACANANVPLWIAYYRRAMPRFLKIKELINTAIGDVRTVSIQLSNSTPIQEHTPTENLPWRYHPELSGGGLFVDVGSHQIDLLNYYFGNITEVKGYATNRAGLYPVADTAVASFKFESGIIGSGVWNFAAGTTVDETTIVGSKGALKFAVFEPTPFTLTTDAGVQTFDLAYPEHVHQPLVETIIAELLGTGTCPSTGESARHTNWFIDEVLKTYHR
ncbi:MAG: Gfo/Idh/MocA family oxidoreductase [Aggregatilineales bacterium]